MSGTLPSNPNPPAPRPSSSLPGSPQKKGELPGMSPDAVGYRPAHTTGVFTPKAAVPTAHPRKVKNGVKLASRTGPVTQSWAGQRWMRLIEDFAASGAMAEGLIYARAGQVRGLNINPGHVHASVQGRMPYAYTVDIRLPVITPAQWATVLDAMSGEARHVAGLLGGEVPANIEDLFSPLRLRLFPLEVADLSVTCSCGHCLPPTLAAVQPGEATTSKGPIAGGWCKHVACVMTLLAERLGNDTFLVFALRGIQRDDLLENLRTRRARQTNARAAAPGAPPPDTRPVPVYLPRLAGADEASVPLEQTLDHFWSVGQQLHAVDLTMNPPTVSHPLLRRLGSSPFDAASGARFPLVGLLATCYDVVSQHTLSDERHEIEVEAGDEPAGSDAAGSPSHPA